MEPAFTSISNDVMDSSADACSGGKLTLYVSGLSLQLKFMSEVEIKPIKNK